MLHSYNFCIKKNKEVGRVTEVSESFLKVEGLPGAVVGETVAFQGGRHGQVMALREDVVEVLVLSRHIIKAGTKVARSGRQLTISLGEGVLGHTLDAFGYAKDERRFRSDFPEEREIITVPFGMVERAPVSNFMTTGVSVVDLLLPIGWGQRELIIGDRKTGKTHFLLQTVLTQASMGRVCIYGAIGKRKEEIKTIEEFFQKHKIEDRTVIVAADSYDSPGEVYLAPYTAMTIAEYFRDKGINVLLILDDLTTHAKYYRELSLIGKRFPGRESYPGDVFHIHSRLLERAGSFAKNGQKSSITALPVAESAGADFTGYIQTNLMSITDGHIYFDNEYFLKGARPAVNVFLSVTRVGRQTQTPLMRGTGIKLMGLLKKHENLQKFLSFGQELGSEAKTILELGDSIKRFFTQTDYSIMLPNVQLILVALLWVGYWDGKNANKIVQIYSSDVDFKDQIDKLIESSKDFDGLCGKVKVKSNFILNKLRD